MSQVVQLSFVTDALFLRDGLSAVVQVGDYLWVANDETTYLERLHQQPLSADGIMHYADHSRVALQDYLQLPVPPPLDHPDGEEIDIEGLAFAADYLWLIGSHSLKRKPIKSSKSTQANIQRLQKVTREGNRFLLARLPLDTQQQVHAFLPHQDRVLSAAQLPGNAQTNELIAALHADEHLKDFFAIPSKDNGFDIEGLAVRDSRLWIGLRGPVLHGWAVILELQVDTDPHEAQYLQLQPVDAAGNLYRKYFLALDGLGVRDLCLDGDDLLILAGPTMALDGPVRIYRWPQGATVNEPAIVYTEQLLKVAEVPYGQGEDHAEGISLFTPADGGKALVVVYDSAAQARKVGSDSVYADIIPLR